MKLPGSLVMQVVLAGVVGAGGCIIIGDDGSGDEGPAVMDDGTAGATEGEVCFEPPRCDPLAPACADAEVCAPDGTQFSCTPVPPETMLAGLHEPCSPGGLGCDQGLVCLQVLVTGCDGPGCCVALCDLEQPQCSGSDECIAYFTESMCHPELGACVAP